MSDARPHVPPAKSEQRVNTVVIWAVLVFGFTVVYSMTGSQFLETTYGIVVIGVVFVLAFTILLVRLQRELQRFLKDNNEAVAAHSRGELERAREVFWRWSSSRQPNISALARHNVASAFARQGKLDESIDVLLDNEQRHRKTLAKISMASGSAADLALSYALLGKLENAAKWLAEAESRAKAHATMPVTHGMIAFARAVLDCRAGRAGDAARALEERWPEYEATMTGESLRPLRVVRAFAVAAAGPRDAGRAEPLLAAARPPAYAGEYDFLGVAWPDMAQFLAAHGLARAPAPDHAATT